MSSIQEKYDIKINERGKIVYCYIDINNYRYILYTDSIERTASSPLFSEEYINLDLSCPKYGMIACEYKYSIFNDSVQFHNMNINKEFVDTIVKLKGSYIEPGLLDEELVLEMYKLFRKVMKIK